MDSPRQSIRLLFFAISAFLLFASCGLPQLTFLAPPTSVSIADEAPPVIRFSHDTVNDSDSFRGYTIYYKFYDNAANDTGCRSDRDYITGTPITINPDRLRSRGYHEVILNDTKLDTKLDTIIPISNRSTASRWDITIPVPINRDAIATIKMIGNETKYLMYRTVLYIQDNSSEYKPFSTNPNTILSTADADLQQGISNPVDTNNLYVAFYGIARGFDINNSFRVIYSEPRFLGYLSMSALANARSQQCNDGLE